MSVSRSFHRGLIVGAAALVSLSSLGALAGLPRASATPGVATAVITDNGEGNLGLSLTSTPDMKVKVSWVPPVPASRIKDWVVHVSTGRSLLPDPRTYTAPANATSIVIPRAAQVRVTSGDYTFVKVTVERKSGVTGSSPTKWIKAPVLTAPASSTKVTLATFNVRNWGAESSVSDPRSWMNRRADVVNTIVASGARVVAIQEASGSSANTAYGGISQRADLLRLMRQKRDTWRLADGSHYGPNYLHGRQGNRILYDSSLFSVIDHGVMQGTSGTPGAPGWVPWARLKELRSGASFFVVSVHFEYGKDAPGSTTFYDLRQEQAKATIALIKDKLAVGGVQVFVAGDFNSTSLTLPNNGVHQAFVKAGFFDAFATKDVSGATYPTTNSFVFPVRESPYRRDYIMSYGGPRGSYWYKNMAYKDDVNTASDHFMQVSQMPF